MKPQGIRDLTAACVCVFGCGLVWAITAGPFACQTAEGSPLHSAPQELEDLAETQVCQVRPKTCAAGQAITAIGCGTNSTCGGASADIGGGPVNPDGGVLCPFAVLSSTQTVGFLDCLGNLTLFPNGMLSGRLIADEVIVNATQSGGVGMSTAGQISTSYTGAATLQCTGSGNMCAIAQSPSNLGVPVGIKSDGGLSVTGGGALTCDGNALLVNGLFQQTGSSFLFQTGGNFGNAAASFTVSGPIGTAIQNQVFSVRSDGGVNGLGGSTWTNDAPIVGTALNASTGNITATSGTVTAGSGSTISAQMSGGASATVQAVGTNGALLVSSQGSGPLTLQGGTTGGINMSGSTVGMWTGGNVAVLTSGASFGSFLAKQGSVTNLKFREVSCDVDSTSVGTGAAGTLIIKAVGGATLCTPASGNFNCAAAANAPFDVGDCNAVVVSGTVYTYQLSGCTTYPTGLFCTTELTK